MPEFEITIEPARELRDLEKLWRALEARAKPPVFLSWAWIGSWLAELPGEIEPLCLCARLGQDVVGLAIFCPSKGRRLTFRPYHRLHLHATGRKDIDAIAIEHNGLLLHPDYAEPLARMSLHHLMNCGKECDELRFDAIAAGSLLAQALKEDGVAKILKRQPAPFIDFKSLGSSDYLRSLSRNTRQQLNRAARLIGNLDVERATTRAFARDIWRELEELHQAQWQKKGKPGAFSNSFFRAFHERLISTTLSSGTVRLLKIKCRNKTIGCLYNLHHADRVFAYQSGVVTLADQRIKPGLLCHLEAIRLSREEGALTYDFLAGDQRFKKSLANAQAELLWLRQARSPER